VLSAHVPKWLVALYLINALLTPQFVNIGKHTPEVAVNVSETTVDGSGGMLSPNISAEVR
jgi:hypothetical protein